MIALCKYLRKNEIVTRTDNGILDCN